MLGKERFKGGCLNTDKVIMCPVSPSGCPQGSRLRGLLDASPVLQPQENIPWMIRLWHKQGDLCQSPHYERTLPPSSQLNAKNPPRLNRKNNDFLHMKVSVWLYSVRRIFFFLVSHALWSHKIKMRFYGQVTDRLRLE